MINYNKSGTITKEVIFDRCIPEPNTGCWIFAGAWSKQGYGMLWDPALGKPDCVHRHAYRLWHGEIPDGYHVDHMCRMRCCCNPDHLRAVTPQVNILAGIGPSVTHAQKTHCSNGHEFTHKNTYILRYKNGKFQARKCRECNRLYMARRQKKEIV